MTYEECRIVWENARREVERLLYSPDRAALANARTAEKTAWDALLCFDPCREEEK